MSKMVQYKELPKYQGIWVGDDGTVWSEWAERSRHDSRSPWVRLNHKRQLPIVMHRYAAVSLYGWKRIHVLVLETFVGPCPEGLECRHLDGNRENNSLSNLCWGTPQENSDDRARHGTVRTGRMFGADNPTFKLDDEDKLEIVRLRESGWNHRQISEEFNVSRTLISNILRSVRAI